MALTRRAVLVLLLVLAPACGNADGQGGREEVVVLGAASLTDAFTEVAAVVEAAHPDLAVTLSFAGSQSLVAQVLEGAPADLLATADTTQMGRAVEADLLDGPPIPFATSPLAIVVEAGNPHDIGGLADLADPAVVLVLAAPEVPAGRFAAQALARAGVEVAPSSLELDVRAALSKVELGEADAAVVYAADLVTAADTVEGIAIPEADNVVATYPVGILAQAPNPDGARRFLEVLQGEQGRAILAAHGFTAP